MPRLYPYQVTGAEWLASKRFAYLADEMRVGKTPQAITACDLVGAQRILVVCPAVARLDWGRKFDDFSGAKRPQFVVLTRRALLGPRHGITIVSYDLFQNSHLEGQWDVVILDEAHYLKHPAAKRTKAILGKGGVVHRAKRVWCLGGTPAPNNASELWPVLHVFGVYTGTYEDFVREFCTGYFGPYGFQITGSKNTAKLRALLKPFMLRRTLKEVFPEMTPIMFSDYLIDRTHPMPEEIGTEYELAESLVGVTNIDEAVRILQQQTLSTATLRRHIGILKVAETVNLVCNELESGVNKIVLFAVHRDVIDLLDEQLVDYNPVVIHGGTRPSLRDLALKLFNTDSRHRVFIGQVVAAGTAIDLSVADDALFVEASWVPGENAQAAHRLMNINACKRRLVTVRFMALADSIDEQVQRILRRKTRDLTALFD
jgi:SNF2 family DNA or RNA helicase